MNENKDINEIKKNYKLEAEHNKKIVRILKMVVYILTVLLFLDMIPYFIIGIMMEKSNVFFDNFSMPIGIIIFGIIAILLTQINPRISRTTDVKADRLMLVIGIIITLLGFGYLIYAFATM